MRRSQTRPGVHGDMDIRLGKHVANISQDATARAVRAGRPALQGVDWDKLVVCMEIPTSLAADIVLCCEMLRNEGECSVPRSTFGFPLARAKPN